MYSENFVAFSEYMNFTTFHRIICKSKLLILLQKLFDSIVQKARESVFL